IAKWQAKYPKLVNWVEDNIEETLSFYRLPLAHHKHMKSTDDIDKPDFDFFDSCCVSLFGSDEPVSSSRPTGFPMRACRDAVKAGRRDGGTAGCEVSRPRLDWVEHGASLERTEAAVVPAHSLCYICPARTTTRQRVVREDESAATQPL
ncbi:transposase, partial [Mesorhizobium sp. M0134]|uniref:transposase n=2 Tax=Mesorhizobium TaxID=68287 RepID=UPI00333A1516